MERKPMFFVPVVKGKKIREQSNDQVPCSLVAVIVDTITGEKFERSVGSKVHQFQSMNKTKTQTDFQFRTKTHVKVLTDLKKLPQVIMKIHVERLLSAGYYSDYYHYYCFLRCYLEDLLDLSEETAIKRSMTVKATGLWMILKVKIMKKKFPMKQVVEGKKRLCSSQRCAKFWSLE